MESSSADSKTAVAKELLSEQGRSLLKKKKISGFEEWGGYMESKKLKLEAQFERQKETELADKEFAKSDIFKGISIFINGYTKPSADTLKKLMILHGGTYHHYFVPSRTTHVIASNLPNSKIRNMKDLVVVSPNWIVESIEAGNILSHQNYLLYPPEYLNAQNTLTNGDFLKSKLCSPDPNGNKSIKYDKEYDSTIAEIPFEDSNQSPVKHNWAVNTENPNFLNEFYNRSRLHHISTSAQELKLYVQELMTNHTAKNFPGRKRLKALAAEKENPYISSINNPAVKNEQQKVIMHVDMDCFFVSVGLLKHPELRGQPVVVTHSKGRKGGAQEGSDIHYEARYYQDKFREKGTSVDVEISETDCDVKQTKMRNSKDFGSLSEIASCSYEAREAGIKNGMFLGEALKRCPSLKTIPYCFEEYTKISKQLYDIIASYTLDIEAISCDELYLDCTELLLEISLTPLQFASLLRAEIKEITGCSASTGIGSNMLLARLATRVAKPNSQYFVLESEIEEFMKEQNVSYLPGVGYTTSKKLESLGVVTCGNMKQLSISQLQQEFGPKTGQALFDHCRGKDDKVLQVQKECKSVSAEINYGIRFKVENDVHKFINELSTEVNKRLLKIRKKGKSLTLKLMVRKQDAPLVTAKFMGHGICDRITKSITLKVATDDPKVIASESGALIKSMKIKPEDYRGVGIQISKLENSRTVTSEFMENYLSRMEIDAKKFENEEINVTNSTDHPNGVNDLDKISSVGTIDIESIRKLMKEWFQSSIVPREDDVEEFKCFLLDIVNKDMKQVDVILKYFFRLTSSSNGGWKQAYLSTLSYMQKKALQDFGSLLEINAEFPSE